jgi:hypothetical protein
MKIPPFGKPLRDLIASGGKHDNDIYLFIGQKAWDRGKSSSISRPTRTLILPPGDSPLIYHWPVNGCDILLIETSPVDTDYIEHFVNTLFSYGSNIVRLMSNNLSLTIHKKDF